MALYVTAHRDLLRSASLLRELPAVAVAHRGCGYPSPAVTRWSVARSPLAAAGTVPDRPGVEGALVTPQPAVICGRLYAQTRMPPP